MSPKNKKTIAIAVAVLVITAAAVAAFIFNSKKPVSFTNSTIAMGTVINQTVYTDSGENSKQTASSINKLINELDRKNLSWRIENSDIYNINANSKYEVTPVTAECIKTCIGVSEKCGGLFDITVGDLSTLWSIGTEEARVPSEDEIQSVLPLIDYRNVVVDGNTVKIADGQKIDLGSVGKGLACDEIKNLLNNTAAKAAVVSVGGSVLIYGENPNTDDGLFNIGVRNPFGNADEYAGILKTGECCISTSGDYEKVLVQNGVKYHHILNPKTGYPAESNITSVTVVSNSGALSDALSTACFILGYSDESLELLRAYNSEALFITKDKKVYLTAGLAGKFTATDDSFKAEVIK